MDDIDLSTLPKRVDAKTGADLVTRFLFPVSPRSLERWSVWQSRVLVNGRNVLSTEALLAEANERLNAAQAA
jgi:hypothetical protein